MNDSRTIIGGASIGGILAIVVSWSVNHSILWALFHGMFGWLYILYYVLVIK